MQTSLLVPTYLRLSGGNMTTRLMPESCITDVSSYADRAVTISYHSIEFEHERGIYMYISFNQFRNDMQQRTPKQTDTKSKSITGSLYKPQTEIETRQHK